MKYLAVIAFVFVLLTLTLISCYTPEFKDKKVSQPAIVKRMDDAIPPRPKYKSVREIIDENDSLVHWISVNSGYPKLYFAWARDSVTIEFDGQCEYTFPVKSTGNKIEVNWAVVEDCTHDIGIRHSYSLKNIPLLSKPFLKLNLLNDSTLKAEYIYPEWVEKVNSRYNGYKTFPDTFMTAKYY